MRESRPPIDVKEDGPPAVASDVDVCRDAIFIWIPKVAGTSISAVLQDEGAAVLKRHYLLSQCNNRGIACFGHMKIIDLADTGVIQQEYMDRAFKFTFVRNPWDRCVSLYHYLTKVSSKGRSPVRPDMSFSRFCLGLFLNELLGVGFKVPPVGLKHVDHLSQCNPQLDWLTDENGMVFTNYIGRYENLENDFDYVRERLGIKGTLPKKNAATRLRGYRVYYNAVTRAIVGYVYRHDVNTFDYEF